MDTGTSAPTLELLKEMDSSIGRPLGPPPEPWWWLDEDEEREAWEHADREHERMVEEEMDMKRNLGITKPLRLDDHHLKRVEIGEHRKYKKPMARRVNKKRGGICRWLNRAVGLLNPGRIEWS